MRIDFHPDAADELEHSAGWYAERSVAACRGFVLAFEATLKKIASDSERFPKIDQRHRASSIERYPFQVVYRAEGDTIRIIAVAHAKRRPGYWRSRTQL